MRFAVFSDIHANLEALESIIADSKNFGIHKFYCLGDIVGYGANPNACILKIRSMTGIECVLGNHDQAAGHRNRPIYDMNPMAQESILWTRKRLTEESRQYLKTLPPTIVTDEIIFAHASPWNPLRWRYVMENEDAQRVFFSTRQKILFIGHTHFSRVITQGVFSAVFEDPSACSLIYTGGNKRFIVNCGSVGQPRDEDPRASYVIHDTERKTLLFRRVEYDCSRAAEKILDAGLPEFLASRLFKGI